MVCPLEDRLAEPFYIFYTGHLFRYSEGGDLANGRAGGSLDLLA